MDHVVRTLLARNRLFKLGASSSEQYNVNINHDFRETSGRRNTCRNDRARMMGCKKDWTQTDLRLLLQKEKEKKRCKVDWLQKDGAYFLQDENDVPGEFLEILRDDAIFEEALPFVQTLSGCFVRDTLESSAGVVREFQKRTISVGRIQKLDWL